MALKNEASKYESGEKVLCFHGPLLYQAKILDVKLKDEEYQYFVHYQGWNKNWDEWVKDERMFKYDSEGLRMQKDVEKLAMSGKKLKILRKSDLKKQPYPPPEIIEHIGIAMEGVSDGPGSPKTEDHEIVDIADSDLQVPVVALKIEEEPTDSLPPLKAPSNAGGAGGRKRRAKSIANATGETDEGFLTRTQIKVDLTYLLKAWLVDDWDLITKQSRLVKLPARKPITSVLEDYLEQSHVQQAAAPLSSPFVITQEFRREFADGLKVNFNFILGSQLLYKFERPQYAELLKSHAELEMAKLYGPMHLLRLLVKLKDLITFVKADPTSADLLSSVATDFVAFLNGNHEKYFKLEDYVMATPDYLRAAMC